MIVLMGLNLTHRYVLNGSKQGVYALIMLPKYLKRRNQEKHLASRYTAMTMSFTQPHLVHASMCILCAVVNELSRVTHLLYRHKEQVNLFQWPFFYFPPYFFSVWISLEVRHVHIQQPCQMELWPLFTQIGLSQMKQPINVAIAPFSFRQLSHKIIIFTSWRQFPLLVCVNVAVWGDSGAICVAAGEVRWRRKTTGEVCNEAEKRS